ncbi:MAG: hypothetical protein Kow0031_03100 [Anaerolineae bacterium]
MRASASKGIIIAAKIIARSGKEFSGWGVNDFFVRSQKLCFWPIRVIRAANFFTDRREFRIVKIVYKADELARQLTRLGWQPAISETPHYFIYGQAGR